MIEVVLVLAVVFLACCYVAYYLGRVSATVDRLNETVAGLLRRLRGESP